MSTFHFEQAMKFRIAHTMTTSTAFCVLRIAAFVTFLVRLDSVTADDFSTCQTFWEVQLASSSLMLVGMSSVLFLDFICHTVDVLEILCFCAFKSIDWKRVRRSIMLVSACRDPGKHCPIPCARSDLGDWQLYPHRRHQLNIHNTREEWFWVVMYCVKMLMCQAAIPLILIILATWGKPKQRIPNL